VTSFINILPEIYLITALVTFLLMLWATVVSYNEKEKRATLFFLTGTIVLPLFFLLPVFIENLFLNIFAGLMLLTGFLAGLFLLLPLGNKKLWKHPIPVKRIDSRKQRIQ